MLKIILHSLILFAYETKSCLYNIYKETWTGNEYCKGKGREREDTGKALKKGHEMIDKLSQTCRAFMGPSTIQI